MTFLPSMPDGNLLDVFKRWPEIADRWQEYVQQVMRGPSPLAEGERELLAAYVSRLNGCGFCEASHKRVAERFGFDRRLVDELDRNIDSSSLSEKQKALFHLAKKLTNAPSCTEQGNVDSLLAAGWDEDAVLHAIHVCCAFNAINRLVEGLGIEVDEELAERGAKMLHEKGYASAKQLHAQKS